MKINQPHKSVKLGPNYIEARNKEIQELITELKEARDELTFYIQQYNLVDSNIDGKLSKLDQNIQELERLLIVSQSFAKNTDADTGRCMDTMKGENHAEESSSNS